MIKAVGGMIKAVGGLLIALSLACIISTFVDVVSGKISLFSVDTVGRYIFHPVTMIAGVLCLARKPKTQARKDGE